MEGVTSSEIENVLEGVVNVTSSNMIMRIYGKDEIFAWEKFLDVSAKSVLLQPQDAIGLMPALLELAVGKDLDGALNKVFSFVFSFFSLLLILSCSSLHSCRLFRS